MRARVGRWAFESCWRWSHASASAQSRPRRAGAGRRRPPRRPPPRRHCRRRSRSRRARSTSRRARSWSRSAPCSRARPARPRSARASSSPREGHIVTNFHVVSEAALKPERHDLVYVTADGREAPLQILQLDVLHDLALLQGRRRRPAQALRRAARSAPRRSRCPRASASTRSATRSTSASRSRRAPTTAWCERSFYPQIFFGGALSAGMSGGPALDEEGHVVGINVARRVDGEQVSFLVPATFATALLARGRDAAPITGPGLRHRRRAAAAAPGAARPSASSQQGWKSATHPRYRVPVPPDVFMRCWGIERAVAHRRPRLRALRLRDGHAHLRRRLHHRHDQHAPRELRRLQARPAALRGALLAELPQRVVPAPVAAAPDQAALQRGLHRSRRPAAARRRLHARLQEAAAALRRRRCWSPRSTRPRPACRAASTPRA